MPGGPLIIGRVPPYTFSERQKTPNKKNITRFAACGRDDDDDDDSSGKCSTDNHVLSDKNGTRTTFVSYTTQQYIVKKSRTTACACANVVPFETAVGHDV